MAQVLQWILILACACWCGGGYLGLLLSQWRIFPAQIWVIYIISEKFCDVAEMSHKVVVWSLKHNRTEWWITSIHHYTDMNFHDTHTHLHTTTQKPNAHTHMYIEPHTHPIMFTHKHECIYIYIYIHTHTQTLSLSRSYTHTHTHTQCHREHPHNAHALFNTDIQWQCPVTSPMEMD